MESKNFPILCEDKDCTGCAACVNICNHGALTLACNEEGFYRPRLNEDVCIGCGMCEKTCPILNPPDRNPASDAVVYAAWHRDDEIRNHSSSGGAFTALAETMLGQGGLVAGAVYTEDMSIAHTIISDANDLVRLRRSKYAQSRIGSVYADIRSHLRSGKKVMFVGTPCQVAGLKCYMGKDYENLLLVDFICHGVPSTSVLHKYIEWLSSRFGKINHLVFRDKRKGWYDNLRIAYNESGREITLRGKYDVYWFAFNNNNNLQESCYACKALGFPRASDITLADFWRIGHRIPFGHRDDIEKGVSMIVANNGKAKAFIKEVGTRLYLEERTLEEAIAGNIAGIQSCDRPKERDTFYKDLNRMDFETLCEKYMVPNVRQRMLKLFREYLPYCIIKRVRLANQK
ncbi:MAG: Coenzyme F420 hydrogenase/dehydrogenase, beta subunit C-terminal domain [Prevotella sp.]|nr:Coenzyme F420 hydrogenase/dehydrogenase, beta subunit C-terminal domain [Prevotella sp.]